MVQPRGLGTGVLAGRFAVGLEPEARTGAPAQAAATAYHRVCCRHAQRVCAPMNPVPVQGYGPPAVALPWKAGRFSGQDFTLQPDGVLLCPESKTLRPTQQRREADGSLRVLYRARIRDCRDCPQRPQCQWHGEATTK